MRVVHERHLLGLFPRATWRRLLVETGFEERPAPTASREVAGEIFLAVRP